MLHCGITGGIGSGKTTVCKVFEVLGIPVYYADSRAKYLMNHEEDLRAGISSLFGEKAYGPDGRLDRGWIAKQVFRDRDLLQKLNELVHPAVARDGLRWQQEQQQSNAPYTLKEAALLYESGSYRLLDKIIVVTAPEELRIQRVVDRDGLQEQEVRDRMDKQMPESEKVERADFVIINDGSHSLIRQVLRIHQALKNPDHAE